MKTELEIRMSVWVVTTGYNLRETGMSRVGHESSRYASGSGNTFVGYRLVRVEQPLLRLVQVLKMLLLGHMHWMLSQMESVM